MAKSSFVVRPAPGPGQDMTPIVHSSAPVAQTLLETASACATPRQKGDSDRHAIFQSQMAVWSDFDNSPSATSAGDAEAADHASFQKFGYINATVFLQSDALSDSIDFLDDDSNVHESDLPDPSASEHKAPDGFERSFTTAGFQDYSSDPANCYFHPHGYKHGVTVEWSAVDLSDLQITVDGIDTQDLHDWSLAQLEEDVTCFGAGLLEWTTAQRSGEGFVVGGDEEGADSGDLDFLPTPQELGVDCNRPLLIYTWGRALRKSEPIDSQFNFNAGVLSGRGGGVDLRTMNGTWEEVQNNVASCSKFPRWLEMVCNKIEQSTPQPLHTISINCTKGRHRSVAAAEIMKRFYYPNAILKHLTIY